MVFSKQLEDLAKKLYGILPKNAQMLEDDIKSQFKEILQSTLNHLDLVTREEFDVQVKVLARSREKIEALEKEVHKMLKESNKGKKKE